MAQNTSILRLGQPHRILGEILGKGWEVEVNYHPTRDALIVQVRDYLEIQWLLKNLRNFHTSENIAVMEVACGRAAKTKFEVDGKEWQLEGFKGLMGKVAKVGEELWDSYFDPENWVAGELKQYTHIQQKHDADVREEVFRRVLSTGDDELIRKFVEMVQYGMPIGNGWDPEGHEGDDPL